jgi:mannose-6-phosphate isomerase-like protein (cupin superfamily)
MLRLRRAIDGDRRRGERAMIAKRREDYQAYRISPGDTNRLVLVFDPSDGAKFLFAIEIFDVGGKTPPNVHAEAQEMFYVLHGEGIASCGDERVPVRTGDSLLLPPGTMHVVENTGATRLYCLTLMVPNEGFAELIRSGAQVPIDDEDWAVLLGGRPAPR